MLRSRRALVGAVIVAALACGYALASASGFHVLHLFDQNEAARLIQRLGLQPGMTVAEIGAGEGEMTVAVATHLGRTGRVLSTELSDARLADMKNSVGKAGLDNVTIVKAGEIETNLPPGCCDAVFMRNVYHHFTNPAATNSSIHAAVRPGGTLAIIDFEPRGVWKWLEPAGPSNRGGHGVPIDLMIQEVTGAGFSLVSKDESWARMGYLLVFRRS